MLIKIRLQIIESYWKFVLEKRKTGLINRKVKQNGWFFTGTIKYIVEAVSNYVRYNFHRMISCSYFFPCMSALFSFSVARIYLSYSWLSQSTSFGSLIQFSSLNIPQALVFVFGPVIICHDCECTGWRGRMWSRSREDSKDDQSVCMKVSNLGSLTALIWSMKCLLVLHRIISICKDGWSFQNLCP